MALNGFLPCVPPLPSPPVALALKEKGAMPNILRMLRQREALTPSVQVCGGGVVDRALVIVGIPVPQSAKLSSTASNDLNRFLANLHHPLLSTLYFRHSRPLTISPVPIARDAQILVIASHSTSFPVLHNLALLILDEGVVRRVRPIVLVHHKHIDMAVLVRKQWDFLRLGPGLGRLARMSGQDVGRELRFVSGEALPNAVGGTSFGLLSEGDNDVKAAIFGVEEEFLERQVSDSLTTQQ